MKTRSDYVTNSSSSSFVISRSALSSRQVDKILRHTDNIDPMDYWDIEITEHKVKGSTSMDNFDMESYLHEIVNINPNDIEWTHY